MSSFLGPASQNFLRSYPDKASSCIFRTSFESDLNPNIQLSLTESWLIYIIYILCLNNYPLTSCSEDHPLSAWVMGEFGSTGRTKWEITASERVISLFAVPHQLCLSADIHQGFSKQQEKLPGCPMFSTACQELLKWHIQAPRQRSCRNFDLDQGSQKLQLK